MRDDPLMTELPLPKGLGDFTLTYQSSPPQPITQKSQHIPSLSDTPTLPLLQRFPTSSTNIIKKIGVKSHDLGMLLLNNDTGKIIGEIETKYGRDSNQATEAILQKWLEGAGRTPRSWDTLLTVLKEIKFGELAKEIEVNLDTDGPSSWSLHKDDVKKLTPDPTKFSMQRVVDENNQIKVSEAPLLTEQCFVYTGKHMEFIWEEAGISLHFPAASCERDIKVSVEILTNIEGNCILPKGYRLMPAASATYKITASAHFPAPVRLRMEHCAIIEKENSLVYMVAPCSIPYNFKAVGKGKFNESHGEIEIKHFSIWRIL